MKKLLIAMMVLASVNGFAANKNQRGQDGSGGGGICVNDKCKTLAEAGFRVLPKQAGQEVSPDVIDELNKISGLLPPELKLVDVDSVIGAPGDIRFVTEADPVIAKKFLTEYQAVLSVNNGKNYLEKFELFGFTATVKELNKYYIETEVPKTFLIENKYNKLSSRGKALLLIHEHSLRILHKPLPLALEFDEGIIEYLKAKENNDWKNFDMWKFLYFTRHYDRYYLNHSTDYLKPLIADFIHKLGGIVPVRTFSKDEPYFDARKVKIKLNYAKILELNKYDSKFSIYATPAELETETMITRETLLKEYINIVQDNSKRGVYVYTKKGFESFMANKIQNDPLNANIYKALSTCKGKMSRDYYLVSLDTSTEHGLLRKIGAVSCFSNFSQLTREIAMLVQYLDGLNLNIPGKLVCKNYGSYCEAR